MSTTLKLSIIIPFHHEEDFIAPTLIALNENLTTVNHEIIAVYDDHNDSSLPSLFNLQKDLPSLRLIQNTFDNGANGAIHTGITHAAGEYVLFFVADDTLAPFMLPQLINHLNRGYDAINTSRYIPRGENSGSTRVARLLSWFGNKTFKWLVCPSISDVTCGIKLFRRDFILSYSNDLSKGWLLPMTLLLRAYQQRLTVIEVPLRSLNRKHTKRSHVKFLKRLPPYLHLCWQAITKTL